VETEPITAAAFETYTFTKDEPESENVTPLQREIVVLRASDPDAGTTTYSFDITYNA